MKMLIDGQTLATPEIHRGIGVVFQRLCEQLVVHDISTEWYISLRDESDLRHLHASVRARLQPLVVGDALRQESSAEQTQAYSRALQCAVAEHHIDAYWNPNPLMTNVVLPTELRGVAIFATIYDIIPWVMRTEYLDTWPASARAEYERRLEAVPAWADHLMFISDNSRKDYEAYSEQVAARAHVIPIAVDATRFWPPLVPETSPQQPYVLFPGGFDPRKNMDRALEAFARLIQDAPEEFADLQFYVVCACSPESRAQYERLAARWRVHDRLVLTGYVEDELLADLYRRASVFFFPSRYEGFGLPVLEAMACGLPVVTTPVSSIPEVAGEYAYYCSTTDTADMAKALAQAFRERSQRLPQRAAAIAQARQYSWPRCAAAYANLFQKGLSTRRQRTNCRRPRIAYVSPWPPQRSGIAGYSRALVERLREHAEVTLYLDQPLDAARDTLDLPVRKLSALPEDKSKLDNLIYHIGNNRLYHKNIYKMAWQHAGVVVLHDYNIHPFLRESFQEREERYYADAFREGYGAEGIAYYQALKNHRIALDPLQYPLSRAIAQRSRAMMVHSRWVGEQLQGIPRVFVVPLGAALRRGLGNEALRSSLRQRLSLRPQAFVIGTFGFINRFKRLPSLLQAVRLLLDDGYPVELVIGGDPGEYGELLCSRIQSLQLAAQVHITGYLTDEEFEECIALSDVIVNLRYPSMGEASGPLMKALGHGKPCIVSDAQQFTELPDSVCWKVAVGEAEVPQLVSCLAELLRRPEVRRQLGENAQWFVEHYASFERVAELYLDVLAQASQTGQQMRAA